MWPWGHAAVGYVVATSVMLFSRGRPLTTREVVVVVVGTQIPDLVDKPLAWVVPVLPSGRSLGHSVLIWAIVSAILLVVAYRKQHLRIASLLVLAYLVGILTDIPTAALGGDLSRATFLVWPILPPPTYDIEPSLVAHLAEFRPNDLFRMLFVCVLLVAGQLLSRKVVSIE